MFSLKEEIDDAIKGHFVFYQTPGDSILIQIIKLIVTHKIFYCLGQILVSEKIDNLIILVSK